MTAALRGRRAAAVVLLLLAGFAATRLALLWRFPPFVDEALYALWAWEIADDSSQLFVSLAFGKEPLLPWLGAVFMGLGFEPLTSVRLVSVVAGLVTLVCTALIARELGGRAAAATAAAICVVLPFFVVHDVIGIYDPLATATAAAALLLLIRLARAPDAFTTAGLGVALGAGILTKQTTYVSLALLPLGAARRASPEPVGGARARLGDRRRRRGDDCGGALLDPVAERALREPRARQGAPVSVALSVRGALPPGLLVRAELASVPITAGGLPHGADRPRRRGGGGAGASPPDTAGGGRRRLGAAPIAAAVLLANEDAPYPRYLLTGIPPIVALAAYGCSVAAAGLRARLEPRAAMVAMIVLASVGVAPAVAFDARVLIDPATARYPGAHDFQYATGWPAGGPWRRVAADLRRLGGGPASVVIPDPYSDTLKVLLRSNPEFRIVRYVEGDTLYGVTNGRPLPRDDIAGVWRELRRYERPRDGVRLVLYQRGIEVAGAFVTSPEALRSRLALSDAEFDRFLARRPDVREWYVAWYSAGD